MYDIALVAAYLLMQIGTCYPRTLHDAIYCSDAMVERRFGKHLVSSHAKRVGTHFFYPSLNEMLIVDDEGLLNRKSEDHLASAARGHRPYEIGHRYGRILDVVADRARASRDHVALEVDRESRRREKHFEKNPPVLRTTVRRN